MTYHKKLIEATKTQQKQHQDVIEGKKDKHKNPELISYGNSSVIKVSIRKRTPI